MFSSYHYFFLSFFYYPLSVEFFSLLERWFFIDIRDLNFIRGGDAISHYSAFRSLVVDLVSDNMEALRLFGSSSSSLSVSYPALHRVLSNRNKRKVFQFYCLFLDLLASEHSTFASVFTAVRCDSDGVPYVVWKISRNTLYRLLGNFIRLETDISRYTNILCAMGLIEKLKGRKTTEAQTYIFHTLSDTARLQIIEDRCLRLSAAHVLTKKMSFNGLLDAGLSDIAMSVFPMAKQDKRNKTRYPGNKGRKTKAEAERDKKAYRLMIKIIDSRIKKDGYVRRSDVFDLLLWNLNRSDDPALKRITNKRAYISFLWANNRALIRLEYSYKRPTKFEKERFNLRSNLFIITKVKPDLKDVQRGVKHLRKDKKVKISNAEIKTLTAINNVSSMIDLNFPDLRNDYFITNGGKLFRLKPDSSVQTFADGYISNKRHSYNVAWLTESKKQMRMTDYKLIVMCFGVESNFTPEALRFIKDAENSEDAFNRFLSCPVHHIDGNRNNLELSNLVMMTKQQHNAVHSSPA